MDLIENKMIQDSIQEIELQGLQTELDYERALVIERKLRVMAKENSKYAQLRQRLRSCISAYEDQHWHLNQEVDDEKINRSNRAELIAEQEREFVQQRKKKIRVALAKYKLNQKDLAVLLGHKSKTYISELVNGVCPFTLRDLTIIHYVLGLSWEELIPKFLNEKDLKMLRQSIESLNNEYLLNQFIDSVS